MNRFVSTGATLAMLLAGGCADSPPPRPRSAPHDAPAPGGPTAAPTVARLPDFVERPGQTDFAPAASSSSSAPAANDSPSVQLDTSTPWPTELKPEAPLVRPALQTFTLAFGAAPSGRLEGHDDIAGARSRRDCKKAVAFGTVTPSACPSVLEPAAAEAWVNANDERAVVECQGFRRVALPAVTAASGRARLGEGDSKSIDAQRTVLAGRWLPTTEEMPLAHAMRDFAGPDADGTVSPRNIRRRDEAFVVGADGVVHLAVFVPRERRSVDRTACTCACPNPGSGMARQFRTVYSQTWYAVPAGTIVGPEVPFAVDVVNVQVTRPAKCMRCPLAS